MGPPALASVDAGVIDVTALTGFEHRVGELGLQDVVSVLLPVLAWSPVGGQERWPTRPPPFATASIGAAGVPADADRLRCGVRRRPAGLEPQPPVAVGGSHGRRARLTHGAVTRHCVAHAGCPVSRRSRTRRASANSAVTSTGPERSRQSTADHSERRLAEMPRAGYPQRIHSCVLHVRWITLDDLRRRRRIPAWERLQGDVWG